MDYEIRVGDIVSFQRRLYSVSKYYKGTGRVTLVPVQSTENGRMFIVNGKPHVFKVATVKRGATFQQTSELESQPD